MIKGFSSKYNVSRLVYFETTGDVAPTIRRERQIKGCLRAKKTALMEPANPEWDDLSDGWRIG